MGPLCGPGGVLCVRTPLNIRAVTSKYIIFDIYFENDKQPVQFMTLHFDSLRLTNLVLITKKSPSCELM